MTKSALPSGSLDASTTLRTCPLGARACFPSPSGNAPVVCFITTFDTVCVLPVFGLNLSVLTIVGTSTASVSPPPEVGNPTVEANGDPINPPGTSLIPSASPTSLVSSSGNSP